MWPSRCVFFDLWPSRGHTLSALLSRSCRVSVAAGVIVRLHAARWRSQLTKLVAVIGGVPDISSAIRLWGKLWIAMEVENVHVQMWEE